MAIAEGFQFGRFAEVEVRNYVTGEKTVIPDDFEIDFSFLKSVDEVESASVGQIKIYGLTAQTFSKIRSDGGEVELRCGYLNSEIKTLFIADILTMSQVGTNGTTETTINCSANALSNVYGGYLSAGFVDSSIREILRGLEKLLGIVLAINVSAIPENMRPSYYEYLETRAMRAEFSGSPQQLLNDLASFLDCEISEIGMKTEGGAKIFSIRQMAGGLNQVFKQINAGYKKIDRSSETFQKALKERQQIAELFVTPDSDNQALLLNQDTGLRAVSLEFKIATALETQDLANNEKETIKSIASRSEKERKEAERKQKALDKGKKVKPKQPKVSTIKVNRKSLKITANLNPSVRPQINVIVDSVNPDYQGIFIARSIEFNGNNKQGAWDMIISAEDTMGRYDTIAPQNAILSESEEGGMNGVDETGAPLATTVSPVKNYPTTIRDTSQGGEKQFIPLNGSLGKDTTYGASE